MSAAAMLTSAAGAGAACLSVAGEPVGEVSSCCREHAALATITRAMIQIRNAFMASSAPGVRSLSTYVREDPVQLIQTVVADDQPALALGAVVQLDPGAELVGQVFLEPPDVRVAVFRLAL